MTADEPMTCGRGIAEHADLPAALAKFSSSLADVLESHLLSLAADDRDARPEINAYTALVHDYRTLASTLTAIAGRMQGYRDLPMASHDEEALSSSASMDTFRRYVESERGAAEVLRAWVTRDEEMLRG